MDSQDIRHDGVAFRNPRGLLFFLMGMAVWWAVATVVLYNTTGLTGTWSFLAGWFSTSFYTLGVIGIASRFMPRDSNDAPPAMQDVSPYEVDYSV